MRIVVTASVLCTPLGVPDTFSKCADFSEDSGTVIDKTPYCMR